MIAIALALTIAASSQAGPGRALDHLRVEAVVVRPAPMPTIRSGRRMLVIDNPGAIAISVDDEAPSSVSRAVPLGAGPIRRITLIF